MGLGIGFVADLVGGDVPYELLHRIGCVGGEHPWRGIRDRV